MTSGSNVTVRGVRQVFPGGVVALEGMDLDVAPGEFVAILGPSGCGKSTLLHLSGAMDRPTTGRVLVDGTDVASLDDDALTRLRRERIGFVFQFFNLLPTLTVLENAALPLLLAGHPNRDAESRARALLERVGLSHRAGHYPQQISGGEMQRAAIARAVVHEPALLVADEPTGNLDSENGTRILELLAEINIELGVTILLATHALETASITKRTIRMRDGQLAAEAAG